jgi:uncharacterized protein
MRRHAIRILLLLSMLAIAPWSVAAPKIEAVPIATGLLDDLDRGAYEAAAARFSPEMRAAIGPDKLRAVWQSLPAQAGGSLGRGDARVSARNGVEVVVIPLRHEKALLDAQIALDAKGRIVGFFIAPSAPPPPAPPAADAGFTERDFRIGTGERALPGTLTLPDARNRALLPAVVLVHGSGPHDRDETIGANRPFLDVARGLAEHGIATLRYDKRTHARPQDFASGDFDMDDETTQDAVAAIAALKATPGIDPQRVFVLGHSLGGMLAPRIASRAGPLAGLILLAAPARPVLDILLEQQHRLARMDGAVSADEQAHIELLARQITSLRGDAPVPAGESPMGLPARYWRALDRVDPVAGAKATTLPLLLLHGGRDFQVTEADWQRWKQAFGDTPRATLRHYPALNHLGIAGEGPGSVAEYQTAGNVDARLISDIADWITVQRAPALPGAGEAR